MPSPSPVYRLGVDIGGTFTDIVLVGEDGRVMTRKVSSTPDDYSRAIVEGIGGLLGEAGLAPAAVRDLVHGTTVATNAILEGTGPATGLITTHGFRDNLEIGRLRYPRLYDLAWTKPPPLVTRRWRCEVPGRLDARGGEVEPLDEAAVRAAVEFLVREGVRSLAVVLLHSYANDAHERRVGQIVADLAPGLPVSLSSDVRPEIGEYERSSTTVINAYLRPVVGHYLERLAGGLASAGVSAPVAVMQSSGGVMSAAAAARHPIHIVESGPAAGVIAAQELVARLDLADAITLDMGGTTAKASVIEDGRLLRAAEYEVGAGLNVGNRLNRGAGYILRVPAIDIAEVGAGGGSVVWVDEAGALHVGPRSAGAVPGPVCYGQGGVEPTLTDANLLLGYLNPDALLGGALPIERAAAADAFGARVAQPLGLDPQAAAYGVHQIGVASMVRVVKAVSSERGRDPRRFALVAFGGNGPLHAASVAAELGVRRVVVPPFPGLFSAFGLLVAERARHISRTILRPLSALAAADLEHAYHALEALARDELVGEGVDPASIRLDRSADLRYVGQSFELSVAASAPLGSGALADLAERFEIEHERTYGHRAATDPIELVHVRVRATVITDRPGAPPPVTPASRGASCSRVTYFGPAHGPLDTPILARADVPAAPLPGPAIVEEYDATTVVPPGWMIRRDALGNLVLETAS